jgi:tetratricopeptide (TPR) repeat protein
VAYHRVAYHRVAYHRVACAGGTLALGVALLAAPVSARGAPEMRALHGPRGDIAALLLGGRDGGSLRVAAAAFADCAPRRAADPNATFWVELEAQSLLEAVRSAGELEPGASIRIELYAYAMTRSGEIAASLAEWVRLDVGELEAQLPGGGAKLPARFVLAPGEYQLRVLVREPRSQRFALRILGLETLAAGGDAGTGEDGRSPGGDPDSGPVRPQLSSPAFPEESERWILVRARDGGESWPVATLSSALPVLWPGRSRELLVRGCHLDGHPERAELAARVTDVEGHPAAGFTFRPGSAGSAGTGRSAGSGEAEGAVAAGRLELAEDATRPAPGLYQVHLTATNAAGQASATQPIFVAPAGAGQRGLAWTALGDSANETERRAGEPSTGDTGPAGVDAEVAVEVAAVAGAYRRVLGLLAEGRREAAVDGLVAMQAGLAEEVARPRRAVSRLDDAQNRVTRELLEHDPECLLPVLLLHLDLERRYRQMGDASPFLLEATRSRVRALAQVYAEEASSDMGRSLAALALVELARALEQAQQRLSTLLVLREAIALDPASPEVLLDLAFQLESHGFDDEAATILERLLELAPRSDEGRLRLALSRSRAQRHAEAAELLGRVIRDGGSESVLAVAYQELGYSLIRQQRFEEAVRVLRQAVGRLPRVQRLHLELAYALDRAGQAGAARAAVVALPADDGRPSPRLSYRVPSAQGERRSSEALVRHATARLPLLGQALAASGESR